MKTAGRWLLLPLAAVLVASLALVMAAEATLPNTGDAPARVEAILRAHSGVEVSLPTKVGQAIVAVEDHRFYSHHGIDVLSLVRAGWMHLTTGADGGGATITVQLVENLYLPSPSTVSQAAEVARYALAIERRYTKDQILTMYLNAIYFGDGQWGIAQASEAYFHLPPDQLDWAQASLLAGLPQAPSAYDPMKHFAVAKARQAIVLQALVRYGGMSAVQANAAGRELTRLP